MMTSSRYHSPVHPIPTDTKNHSQRRSTSTSSINTRKAANANPSEKRRRRRLNENERRKRNTPKRLMQSSWRRLKARETMERRKDSSGALRTLGVWSTRTTAPKRLRVLHRGWVDPPCVLAPLLKPQSRCLHPLRPKGQRANAPWIPSWRKSNGRQDVFGPPSTALTSNREQAEREAKYSRHGTSTSAVILTGCLTAIPAHVGRSVTALAGKCLPST